MKFIFRYLGLCISVLFLTTAAAQSNSHGKYETITLHVEGVCDMCKSRIETASYDVSGVKSVEWDLESGILTAVINKKKASRQKIADAVAAAGYDNELAKADPKAYQKLPACCRYSDGIEKHGD